MQERIRKDKEGSTHRNPEQNESVLPFIVTNPEEKSVEERLPNKEIAASSVVSGEDGIDCVILDATKKGVISINPEKSLESIKENIQKPAQ